MKRHKFIETAKLLAIGGKGGNGCASFRREKFVPLGGPDGGNGGDGGSVVLQADNNTSSLVSVSYSPRRQAQNGILGKGRGLHGRNGRDLVIKVPCGTEVWDDATGDMLGDLVTAADSLVVARGGRKGLGNGSWKRGSSRSIDECSPVEPGEQRNIRLEWKIIADAGLVGLPNAGKSSLLSAISRARPRIASFPFTTLHPVLGTVRYENYTDITVVDIPGLIQDASQGVGLGDKFLRHVERACFLIFIIDMSGSDGREPVDDYFVLHDEIRLYSRELAERPSMVVANKMDLPEASARLAEFQKATGCIPLSVSALTGHGIQEFKRSLYKFCLHPERGCG